MIVTGVVAQILLKAGDIIGLIGFFISIFALTTAGALYWKQKQEEKQWRR